MDIEMSLPNTNNMILALFNNKQFSVFFSHKLIRSVICLLHETRASHSDLGLKPGGYEISCIS